MIGGIINFILGFFGGNKTEEPKKLDELTITVNEEVSKLEKEVEELEKEKEVNKKKLVILNEK